MWKYERFYERYKVALYIFSLCSRRYCLCRNEFQWPPLFNSFDNFVLFAQEEIKLEQGVQVSSGDLGSNKEINTDKDIIINGNLFADEIMIDKNTIINGNVSFNKLETKKETKILGTQTKPVQLPIANLPEVSEFQIGTQDFKFEGQNNTLAAGSYHDVVIEKNGRLVLSGGAYNLRKLELKENSTLIFSAQTTLNIQFKLKGEKHVAVLSGNNSLKPTDLAINYLGIESKQEKDRKNEKNEKDDKIEKEKDDDEINQLLDDQERKELKDRKIGRPIVFGKESFLNFKLLAPKASVHIGENTTFRGQVLARKVKVGKDSILSRETTAIKASRPEDIVTDPDGGVYPINEILVSFTLDATLADAQNVAFLINGKIVGIVSSINLY